MINKRYLSTLIICLAIISSILTFPTFKSAETTSENKLVYFIPIENNVERGLEAFLIRAIQDATDAGANHIVFEIDTPGGFVDAAGKIGTLLQDIDVPTTSYIVKEALSAGSFIALHTDNIYMKPGSTMGASGVITSDGNAADKKAQSAWIAAMESVAESKNRDPLYAIAMADDSIDLPDLGAPSGSYLTLTPNNALEVGYAEGIVNNRIELLHEIQLGDATIVEIEPTVAEDVARFITSPIVIPILLSIASLGLIVELYSPGFGVPGTMGIVALLLFFYGHIIAGLAGMEVVILLIVGIGLIIAELFVTGGILGIIGIIAIVVSLFISGYNVTHMAWSIAIAIAVAVIAAIILFKWIGLERGLFRKMILRDQATTELGYISNEDRDDLIGEECVTVTDLRPAGTVVLNNERIDVVSEGDFITKGSKVIISHAKGMRIVVREKQ